MVLFYTPSQHTLSTHPLDTPSEYTSQHTFSLHLLSYQHILIFHLLSYPSFIISNIPLSTLVGSTSGVRGTGIPQSHQGLGLGVARSIFGDPDRQRLPDHVAVRTDLVLNTPILSNGNFAYVGNFRHAASGIQVTPLSSTKIYIPPIDPPPKIDTRRDQKMFSIKIYSF